MSLLDKASIVWPKGAPSKAGNLAAWNPQTSQLVEFDVVRATTKTYVDEDGLIQTAAVNVLPRDFTDGGCGVQKIEPQRTNYVTSSQSFAGTGATVTTGQESPTTAGNEGTTITGDGGSTQPRSARNVTFASAGAKTQYCIAKAGTNDFLALGFQAYSGGSGTDFSYFDLANGTTPTAGAKIISIGNGWYFCISAPYTIAAGDLVGINTVFIAFSDSSVTFPSSGDANGQSINLFHFQAEDGDYSTTPIFTSGSTVTRNADVASLSSAAALLGDSEGGFFIEAKLFEPNGPGVGVSLSDGSFANRVTIIKNTGATEVRFITTLSSSNQCDIIGSNWSGINFVKIAVRYSLNSFSSYLGGSQIGSDTSGSTFSDGTLTNVGFNSGGAGAFFYGEVRQLIIFNQAPTDAQLAAITS